MQLDIVFVREHFSHLAGVGFTTESGVMSPYKLGKKINARDARVIDIIVCCGGTRIK